MSNLIPTPDRPRLALICLAVGPDRHVRRVDAVAHACEGPDIEIVRVDGRQPGLTPGSLRNTGVSRSQASLLAIIDGSEEVSVEYLLAACATLDRNPACGLVAGLGVTGAEALEPVPAARDMTVADLVASPWALSRTGVFRRAALDRAGGFDETLPALVEWDVRLKLVGSGVRGLLLPRTLPLTAPDDDVVLAESLRPEAYLPSIRRIVERHRPLFSQELRAALTGRNRVNNDLWRRLAEPAERAHASRTMLADITSAIRATREELAARGLRGFDWTTLRRTSPMSRNWGSDRGRPIDRYYIDGFVARHGADVRGAVIEMLDAGMTERFGGDRVTRSDVLDIDPGNFRATVVGDLRSASTLAADTYDCVILTQTLHLIDDMAGALKHIHRALAPGGVLLATFPAASMVASEYGPSGDHWRLTPAGARWLAEQVFPAEDVSVEAHGNVLAITASLYGLCCDDIDTNELDAHDPDYPLIVTLRAVKRRRAPAVARRDDSAGAVVLLYHRAAVVEHDLHGMAVTPAHLREHLEILRRHRRPMRLADLAEAATTGDLPPDAIALTFDDGYLDNLTVVLPLLREFGIPATFFLTAEPAAGGRPYWWDTLSAALLENGHLPSSLDIRLSGQARRLDVATPEATRRTYDDLYELLTTSLPAVRDDVLRQLAVSLGGTQPDCRRMTAKDIVLVAREPLIDIGAHTVHHLALDRLQRDELHREVFGCRTSLERITGAPVTPFSYPFGRWSADALRTVIEADYKLAVTCAARPLRRGERAHLLPRLQAPNVGTASFLEWLTASCRHNDA